MSADEQSPASAPRADPIRELLAGCFDLQNLSPGTVEGLRLLAISGDDVETRVSALVLLGKAAKPSQLQVLDTLLEVLKDPHPHVSGTAAKCLLGFGNRSVPAMLRALRESDETPYRATLIVLLGHLGPEAAAAKPMLTQLEGHPELGAFSTRTLARLTPGWEQLSSWLGAMATEWAVVASVIFAALLLIAEIARAAGGGFAGLLPGGNAKEGPPVKSSLVAVFVFIIVAIVQFARAMLRYDQPNKVTFRDSSFRAWKLLLALLVLGVLMTITLYRLQSL